ncbi:MAG: hypothetical protein WCE52_12130 [Candidatus Acidiferrum sp.]
MDKTKSSKTPNAITLPTPDQIKRFISLFSGNPEAHYIRRVNATPFAMRRGIALADIKRHLSGLPPSVLSIPTNRDGLSHFGVIDVDRHGADDAPIDWPALALRIAALHLPLTVCKSTNGKGCWLLLFIKEEQGFNSAVVRSQLAEYAAFLNITGEIFPKQDRVSNIGSGVNLPYFGNTRTARGATGEELTLNQFLDQAEETKAYGSLFAYRAASRRVFPGTGDDHSQPIFTEDALEAFERLLGECERAMKGERNYRANAVCWYAARCVLSGILDETESKKRILAAVQPLYRQGERDLQRMLRDSWNYGLRKGKLNLHLYPWDFECLWKLSDDLQFQKAFDGVTEDFSTAIDAKKYLEQRLSESGSNNIAHILKFSQITEAIAEETLEEFRDRELLAPLMRSKRA